MELGKKKEEIEKKGTCKLLECKTSMTL